MRVGFVGTGKLGLPVSLVYSSKGHELLCFDINHKFYDLSANLYDQIFHEELNPESTGSLRGWLPPRTSIKYRHTTLSEIATVSDIIFVAIQTPHHPKYEGVNRLPEERVDFDYTYLKNGIKSLSDEIAKQTRNIPVIIISTVLPGTIRREIIPLLSPNLKLCYNPYFIAMGTVARDCLNPEFILLGHHDSEAKEKVVEFYKTICDKPIFTTTLENAELIKVCYNTFISTKVALANTIMELCHSSHNTDCDEVINALSLATDRLISPAYLRGGMGDGGGCHPRDNIALSWYSNKIGMRYDWFESIMLTRERQTDFLADIIEKYWKETPMPVILLGKAFKPNTAITTGSPAVLLSTILNERSIPHSFYDPLTNPDQSVPDSKGIYFISCRHSMFKTLVLPSGSIVLDPFRHYKTIIPNGSYIPIGKTTEHR